MSGQSLIASRSRAVVTGASSGIGAEMAKQLAERGIDLFLVARRLEPMEVLAESLRTRHEVNISCASVDLSTTEGPNMLFEASTAEGPVDILINNAGYGLHGSFQQMPIERQLNMIQLNVSSLTELCHRFIPHMLAHGRSSHIMNIASIAGLQPLPTFSAYAATKAYVSQFSAALAHELRDSTIKVTCSHPGATRTEFMDVAGYRTPTMLKGVYMDAQRCARLSLKAMFRGRRHVVTGWLNWFLALMSRVGSLKIQAALSDRFTNLGQR